MDLSSSQQLSFDSEHRLRAENLCFDIDVWYPMLRQFTFKTTFLPLQREEGEAIRNYHDVAWRHLQPNLRAVDIDILLALEREISSFLCRENASNYFVRMCGRSPKDGEPLNRRNVMEDFHCELSKIVSKADGIDYYGSEANQKMVAIGRISWLKVKEGNRFCIAKKEQISNLFGTS